MKSFGIVVLLALILTACGGDDPVNGSSGATADTNTTAGRKSDGSARFDDNGNLIGIYGVPYNPCDYKPCVKK